MAEAIHALAASASTERYSALSVWKIRFASFPPYIHPTLATLTSLTRNPLWWEAIPRADTWPVDGRSHPRVGSLSPTEGFCARSVWKIRFASFPPYILPTLATLASLTRNPLWWEARPRADT